MANKINQKKINFYISKIKNIRTIQTQTVFIENNNGTYQNEHQNR